MIRLTLVLAALLAVSPVAWADDADTLQAKKLFASGTKHFDLGEFDAALGDFKEGYRLKDDPVFLYNIAQCYRLTNDNVNAVRFYRSYLRLRPDAGNRKEVENKIAALEEAIASQEKARTTPRHDVLGPGETGTAPPDQATSGTTTVQVTAQQPTPLYRKWWLWTAVGAVVVVGVAVGLGVGLSQSPTPTHGAFPTVNF